MRGAFIVPLFLLNPKSALYQNEAKFILYLIIYFIDIESYINRKTQNNR